MRTVEISKVSLEAHDRNHSGETWVLTRRGKPVAAVVPIRQGMDAEAFSLSHHPDFIDMPQAGSTTTSPGLGRMQSSTIASMRARGVKYWPAPHVLGVLLEKPLVGVALDVGRHRRPVLLADQLDDELAQLGRVLDLVLGLLEDEAEHPALRAHLTERVAVVLLQRDALHAWRRQILPAIALRDRLLSPVRRAR